MSVFISAAQQAEREKKTKTRINWGELLRSTDSMVIQFPWILLILFNDVCWWIEEKLVVAVIRTEMGLKCLPKVCDI